MLMSKEEFAKLVYEKVIAYQDAGFSEKEAIDLTKKGSCASEAVWDIVLQRLKEKKEQKK